MTSYDGKRYHVTYEDGEIEKYTPKQMKNIVVSPDLEKVSRSCSCIIYGQILDGMRTDE